MTNKVDERERGLRKKKKKEKTAGEKDRGMKESFFAGRCSEGLQKRERERANGVGRVKGEV